MIKSHFLKVAFLFLKLILKQHHDKVKKHPEKAIFMKKTINTLFKATIFFFIFFAGMFVGEFSQILYSQKDLREHAISTWVKENPQKADLAKKFKEECLIGKKKDKEDYRNKTIADPKEVDENTPLPISTIEDCANKNNLRDIYIEIEKADKILHSAAWPLSYLDVDVKLDKNQ